MKKLSLLLVLLLPLSLLAAPILKSTSLRQGSSMLRYANSYGRLDWTLENPDDTEATVTLQLKPSHGGTSEITSRDVTLPPRSRVSSSVYFVANTSDSYLLECIYKGTCIAKDKPLVKAASSRHFSIGVLNDTGDLQGYGKLQQSTALPYKVHFTVFNASSAPPHWAAYEHLSVLLLHGADLDSYSIPQFNAILDYVAMGGALVISHPEAALKAQHTPLASLLPYTPIATSQEDNLARLASALNIRDWSDVPDYDAEGKPTDRLSPRLLHAIPNRDSHLLLGSRDHELAVSRTYGCGLVLGLAFDPFVISQKDQRFLLPPWIFIMQNTGFIPSYMMMDETEYANKTLQLLQGYRIPPVSTILAILACYVLGSLVILIVLFRLKRHATGWLLVCVYGLCVTAFILLRSSGIASSQHALSTANLSLSVWDGSQGASKNNVLLLGRKDLQPRLQLPAEQIWIRQQPPKPTLGPVQQRSAMPASPLWLKSNGETVRLEKLNLQKLRPRAAFWMSTRKDFADTPAQLPVLEVSKDDIHLRDWSLPQDLKGASRAVLAVNRFCRPLPLKDGVVSDSGSQSMVEADTAFLSALDYVRALNKRGPVLALFTTNPSGRPLPLKPDAGGESTSLYDYDVTLVPVQSDSTAKPDGIPAELITWRLPSISLLRSAYKNGAWQNVPCTGVFDSDYRISFHLPPEYAVESPDAIHATIALSIPAQNLDVTPYLLACDGTKIMPADKKGNTYVFVPGGKPVVSRLTSDIELVLNLSLKKNGSGGVPATASIRTNYWKIQALELNITNKESK